MFSYEILDFDELLWANRRNTDWLCMNYFIKMGKAPFNLLDEHIFLRNMEIQSFYELFINGETFRSPSWLIHCDYLISFLKLLNQNFILIFELFKGFSINGSWMIFVVIHTRTLWYSLACLAVIESWAIVRLTHFFVLRSFLAGHWEAMRWGPILIDSIWGFFL